MSCETAPPAKPATPTEFLELRPKGHVIEDIPRMEQSEEGILEWMGWAVEKIIALESWIISWEAWGYSADIFIKRVTDDGTGATE